MDRRPDRVYGIPVQDHAVFLVRYPGGFGPAGGVFAPLAEDRKAEVQAHLVEQLGIVARRIWGQGAFDYRHPEEDREYFSGFYTIWQWDGEIPERRGAWLGQAQLASLDVVPSLKILLTSIVDMHAIQTT